MAYYSIFSLAVYLFTLSVCFMPCGYFVLSERRTLSISSYIEIFAGKVKITAQTIRKTEINKAKHTTTSNSVI